MKNDYDVSVFIITEFNEYILPMEYDKDDDGEGMFVCLTNDELNSEYKFNNSICIYKDWQNKVKESRQLLSREYNVNYSYENERCQWQVREESIPNNENFCIDKWIGDDDERDMYVKCYLDGFLSCQNIMANAPLLLKKGERVQTYIPAIMTTHYTKVKHNGRFYNGYLPSIGQLIYASKNVEKVNDALEVLGICKEKEFKVCEYIVVCEYRVGLMGSWWSSSEHNRIDVWFLCDGITDGYNKKREIVHVLPLFAL